MKIYLAGPDVFRSDVVEWAESARELCRRYGFEPLLPVDHEETAADKIFQANIDLIRKAQVVAANLDPFRGPEPDSGTAFEIGCATALGKRVIAYLSDGRSQVEKLAEHYGAALTREDGRIADPDGQTIENFGLPVNLMLGISCQIVQGNLSDALKQMQL